MAGRPLVRLLVMAIAIIGLEAHGCVNHRRLPPLDLAEEAPVDRDAAVQDESVEVSGSESSDAGGMNSDARTVGSTQTTGPSSESTKPALPAIACEPCSWDCFNEANETERDNPARSRSLAERACDESCYVGGLVLVWCHNHGLRLEQRTR